MSYIYTVKPLKEAIKIAVEHKQLEVNASNQICIYGIDTEFWPAGEKIESAERVTDKFIRKVGKLRFSVPVEYFTEVEDKPEVPEFIINLHKALTSSCAGVKCEKCLLHYVSVGDCDKLGDWLETEYPGL